MRRLILAGFFVVAASYPLSAQTISGISGTLTHGSAVTISGSGFGTKATAPPVKFDDFQSVPAGQPIATSAAGGPVWTSGGSIAPVASTARPRVGTPNGQNMLSRFQPLGGSDPSASNVFIRHDFKKFYLDAWFYHDTSGESSSAVNVKPWRLHWNNTGYPNASGMVWVSGLGGDVVNCAYDGDSPDDGVSDFFPGLRASNIANGWVHLQQWLDYGSGNGAINGTCITRLTGNIAATHSQIGNQNPGRSGYTHWTELYIGNYVRSEDWSGTARFYWDSIYVDDSWARIEIGDSPTYANATHREVQVPSAWTSTSATITVNRGSFPPNAPVYLYVCTESNACSSGYPVTLGGSGGSPALPPSPQNLRIQPQP